MVNELAYVLQYAHSNKNIWIVVLQAKGNVFCAGADLKAMAGMAEPHESSIPQPKGLVENPLQLQRPDNCLTSTE